MFGKEIQPLSFDTPVAQILKRRCRRKNVMVIGNERLVAEIETVFKNRKHGNAYRIVSPGEGTPPFRCTGGREQYEPLGKLVSRHDIDVVIVEDRLKSSPGLRRLLLDLKYRKPELVLYAATRFQECVTEKVVPESLAEEWLDYTYPQNTARHVLYRTGKAFFDRLCALAAILLLLPLMLLIGLVIPMGSNGPVLFCQQRLGKNGKPFTLLKFRTMIEDAEKDTGPRWACQNDPRITPFGCFLRKTHLDELPQLFNILKGDMSFVGPRPIREYFANLLSEKSAFYRLRFSVKPGLTGWGQIRADYGSSEDGQMEKLKYDLYYIKHRSFLFDLQIILKTFFAVILKTGT